MKSDRNLEMTYKERILKIGENTDISYKDGENGMLLLIGTPGCGKTWSIVTRQIADNSGESMVIDDKKGSIFKSTGDILINQGYKVFALNLKTFGGNYKYNIFENVHTEAEIRKITHFLLPDNLKGNDPFWVESARLLLQGVIGVAVEEEKSQGRVLNLESLFGYLDMVDISIDPRTGIRLKNKFDELICSQQERGIKTLAQRMYESIRDSADDTYRSVVVETRAALCYLNDPKLYEMTNHTNFDASELGSEKTALYIISSDTDTSLDPFIKLIYRQILDTLINVADTREKSMLDNHVRFVLDDFASGCVMDNFPPIIANARSRNISFTLCIQSRSQLIALYRDEADSILDCINYKVYFPSANFETQKYLSELLDKPVADIQKMPANKLCLERVYDIPRIINRYDGTKELLNSLQLSKKSLKCKA